MGLNCGCPVGAHLADLSIPNCQESMGQIQKVIIQRVYQPSGERNSLFLGDAGSPSVGVLSDMNSLLAACDSTKLIITPFIQNPETEPGAARTFGGGNQTLNGIELIIGAEPTTFTGVIYNTAQSVIKTMKKYMCENIGVYYIDEYGNIGAIVDPDKPDTIYPIPVQSFFVGDKDFGGLEEPDSNAIQWAHAANWSDNFTVIKPEDFDYNPLVDLVNAASDCQP